MIIGVDPVCAAAAQSYFDATLAGDSDEAASEKAATAYLRYVVYTLNIKYFLFTLNFFQRAGLQPRVQLGLAVRPGGRGIHRRLPEVD